MYFHDDYEFSFFEIFALFAFFILICYAIWDTSTKNDKKIRNMSEIINVVSSEKPVLSISEYEMLTETEKSVFLNNKGTIKE